MNSQDLSCGIKQDEDLCDLQLGDLKIIQKKQGFRFGTDAVLLADFTKLRKRDLVADLGTGTGIISILMCGHNPEIEVRAAEIQPEIADMARRSVLLNGLENRIQVHNIDIKDAPSVLGRGVFDAVVCNPPYYGSGTGAISPDEARMVSRTDAMMTPDGMCECACALLKSGGRLSVVYPARYLSLMMDAMHSHSLEPKRIRTVHYMASRAPKLVLLDAIKHGGAQMDWLPPLILNNEDGSYTGEWHRIYG